MTAPVDVWFHPGLGDDRGAFRAAFRSVLARRFRLLAFDPPGHGRSRPLRDEATLATCAGVFAELVRRLSAGRAVVLVGHSIAGIVASRAAAVLSPGPALVVSIEGNLTAADAYFSGLAAGFDGPAAFRRALCDALGRSVGQDPAVRRFRRSIERADARTLWTLGRSVARLRDPGADFRRLRCPKIHYWDAASTPPRTHRYLHRHRLPQRRFEGLGHWPMLASPEVFYGALAQDIEERAILARAGPGPAIA